MSKYSVFVEGKTDKDFLCLLLDKMKLDKDKVKFFIFGNKSNFFKADDERYTGFLLDIEQEHTEKSLFIIDADDENVDKKYGGHKNTKRELTDIINSLGIANSDIYIMCDSKTKTGYLESLILSSISEDQKQCIDNFLSCSKFKNKENHKAILHQIYQIAYPQAPYDFSHPNFNELKEKLKTLFSTQNNTP